MENKRTKKLLIPGLIATFVLLMILLASNESIYFKDMAPDDFDNEYYENIV